MKRSFSAVTQLAKLAQRRAEVGVLGVMMYWLRLQMSIGTLEHWRSEVAVMATVSY